jgi:hypothetical protein
MVRPVRSRVSEDDGGKIPLLGLVFGCLALTSGIFIFLYWLLQPVKIANAGMAAYSPPPHTRLEPLPRKMDAPELVEFEPISPFRSLAQGEVADSPAETTAKPEAPKQEARREARRKRERAQARREQREAREQREPSWGFAADWNSGYRHDRYRDGGHQPWW